MTNGPDFQSLFGADADAAAWAPGRVNLIGEHTDYQGGFVFPMPLERGTTVAVGVRPGSAVRVFSDSERADGILAFDLGAEMPGRGWVDHVQGVTAALGGSGYPVGGFHALVTSDLPIGAGLASSAALAIALLRALRGAFALAIDDLAVAKLAWQAETQFVGVPVGMMDQIACSLGTPGQALFLDTRSLDWQTVVLPPSVRVLVIDSGIPHRNADSGYRQRRHEVEEAAQQLGVAQLRDVSAGDLGPLQRLPEPLRQRARHVVTENARVLAFRAALAAETPDLAQLGRLLAASHQSLRDDYQVSLPELDMLVTIAGATPGVLGARLTGGGFGGSIVVLVETARVEEAGQQIGATYKQRTGHTATIISSLGESPVR